MKVSHKLNLTTRLGIMIAIFVLATGTAIGVTLLALDEQEKVSLNSDYAGRQRMLTQRYASQVMGALSYRQRVIAAREVSEGLTQQILAVRAKYTQTVVEKLKSDGVGATFKSEYLGTPGAVPLPATIVRETATALNNMSNTNAELKLRSKWNVHPRQGLQSEFERRAWNALESNAERESYWELEESPAGVQLHFARADLASAQGCVSCHNGLEGSPKTDYKMGDLMGLVIASTNVTSDPALAASLMANVSTDGPKPWNDTAELFTTTQAALRDGGDVFVDLAKTKTVTLTPMDDAEYREVLGTVDQSWNELAAAVTRSQDPNLDAAGLNALVQEIQAKADETMKHANSAVSFLMQRTKESFAQVKMIQNISAVVVLVAFIGVILYIRNGVSKPVEAILNRVRSGAEQTSSEAGKLLASSRSVSEGANRQAAAIQESSASLDEMSSMTKQTAQNAQQAKRLMADGTALVEAAQASMGSLTSAINDIKRSSDETAKVAKTIEQIAFQTNLLALNAAVEAARAGEAGEGFAVVAEEVRSLAQRAGEAARETAALIEGALKSADGGVSAAQEASEALASVISNEREVGELVAQIATANGEQADGVHQVSIGVEQLDEIMNRNAADANNSMHASEGLAREARGLSGAVDSLVAVFGFAQHMQDDDHGASGGHHHDYGHSANDGHGHKGGHDDDDAGKHEQVVDMRGQKQAANAPRAKGKTAPRTANGATRGRSGSAAAAELIPFDENAESLSDF